MSKSRKLLVGILLLVLLVLAFMPTIQLLLDGANEEEIEAVQLELREMDVATNLDELLAKLPNDPELFETGERYQQAFDAFAMMDDPIRSRIPLFTRTVKLDRDSTEFESVLHDSRLFLDANANAIKLLRDLSKAEAARFKLDYTKSIEREIPHAPLFHDSARLLLLNAIVAAVDGDTETATASLIAGFRLPNALRYEPNLIVQLVRIRISGMAAEALADVLSHTPLSESQLDQIDKEIVTTHSHPAFRLGIEGELVTYTRFFEEFASDFQAKQVDTYLNPHNPALKHLFSKANWLGWIHSNSLAIHIYIRDFVRVLDGEYEDQTVGYRLVALYEQETLSDTNFSNQLMPALSRAGSAHVREMAYLRAAKTVLAIERYRLNNNARLPEQLSQVDFIEPDFAIDPFTDEPLLIRHEKQGYIVYSVGSNFRDDGAELSDDLPTGERDWYLRVRR